MQEQTDSGGRTKAAQSLEFEPSSKAEAEPGARGVAGLDPTTGSHAPCLGGRRTLAPRDEERRSQPPIPQALDERTGQYAPAAVVARGEGAPRYVLATDHRVEALRALKALDLALAVWDLDQWLRSQVKHGDNYELQPARDRLWEILDAHGIDLEEIID